MAQCLCGVAVVIEGGAVPRATHSLNPFVSEDMDQGVGGELVGKVVGPGKLLDLGSDNSDFDSFYLHLIVRNVTGTAFGSSEFLKVGHRKACLPKDATECPD